jgi:cyclophilin family peptidyl-prolyl cis-trans isomerase
MMNLFEKSLFLIVFTSVPSLAAPLVVPSLLHLQTTLGNIDIELFNEEAPITVKNFLSYVDSGFYTQTIFHRIVKGFVAQTGSVTEDLKEKPTLAPIKNEAANGLHNLRGTLSMARTSEVDSATSGFYINLVDNLRLDHRGETPDKFGYAVFGKVTAGMDVVDQIATVPVHDVDADYRNVPVTPVFILGITKDCGLTQ